MTDSPPPVIETALRGLKGDPESTSSAITLLRSLHVAQPEKESEAIRRWDEQDAKNSRLPWRLLFHASVTLVSLLLFFYALNDLSGYKRLARAISGVGFGSREESLAALNPEKFSDRERLILRMPTIEQTHLYMAKALWDSDPSNAAYFSGYCDAYFADTGKLPPTFSEDAAKVNPDNAYFGYRLAAQMADATTRLRSSRRSPPGVSQIWTILDEPKLDQTLSVLRGTRNQTEFRSYSTAIFGERLPLLPQGSYPEYFASSNFVRAPEDIGYSFRRVSDTFAARAWLCADRSDQAGFLELKKDADLFLRRLPITEICTPNLEVYLENAAIQVLAGMTSAADKLSLRPEFQELETRRVNVEALINARKKGILLIDGKPADTTLAVGHGPRLSQMARLTLHPPSLSEKDVKPRRMLEHELMAQLCAFGTWVLVGIAASFAALYRFRSPRIVKNLAQRIEILLLPGDWLLLGLVGLIPLVYLLAVIRLTPFGGTAVNLTSLSINLPNSITILLPMAQFTGMVIMTIILHLLVTRWILAKRAGFFGFNLRGSWLPVLAFVSAALFIPVIGWAILNASVPGMRLSWLLITLPFGWILAVVIRALTEGMTGLLRFTTISRVLVPSYTVAMVLLLLTAPYFKWTRQMWFEKDEMSRLHSVYGSLSKFEFDSFQESRKELREALGYDQ